MVFEHMRGSSLKPDHPMMASFTKACVHKGDVQGAWEAVQQFVADGNEPQLRSYSAVLRGFCEGGEVREAVEVLEHLLERGVLPTEDEFTHLINSCAATAKHEQVRSGQRPAPGTEVLCWGRHSS